VRIAVVLLTGLVAFGATGLGRQDPSPVPLIHGLASFVIPGLGQYLNEEYDKALTHFAVGVGLGVAGPLLLSPLAAGLPWYYRTTLWVLPYFAWSLYSGWDAYTVALRREGLALRISPTGFSLSF